MEGTNSARAAVDKLLDMYDEHKALTAKIVAAERRVALAKLKNSSGEQIRIELDDLRHNQQQLSDNMTFDTPLVWVMYKFEAYQDEAQPIKTMHDFRLHCSKPGYICTKRFTFLNAHLLSEIFPLLADIEQDEVFLSTWRAHEYYQEDGIVKKWQDYVDCRG